MTLFPDQSHSYFAPELTDRLEIRVLLLHNTICYFYQNVIISMKRCFQSLTRYILFYKDEEGWGQHTVRNVVTSAVARHGVQQRLSLKLLNAVFLILIHILLSLGNLKLLGKYCVNLILSCYKTLMILTLLLHF